MLRSLLQLDAYERMREQASQLGRQATQLAASLHSRLDDGFRDATPERLAKIERRLGELTAEVQVAGDAAELARRRLDAVERTIQLRRELQRARTRRDEVEAVRPQIDTDEQRFERSERARSLVVSLDAAAAARAKHAGEREEVGRLAPQATAAQDAHRATNRALQLALDAAGEIDRLRGVRIRIEQVMPLLPRQGSCQRRIADAEAQRDTAARQLDAAHRDVADRASEAASCAAERDDLELALQQTGHDPDCLQRLADALALAADLAARQRDLARSTGSWQRSTARSPAQRTSWPMPSKP
jgi:hypothetical protein